MDTVICDISALEYWRCPPIIREVELPGEMADRAMLPSMLFSRRANARWDECAVGERLLTDLKGIALPVHLMANTANRRPLEGCFAFHRYSPRLAAQAVSLGGGISVLTPAATLAHLARRLSTPKLLLLAFELAGTYSILHKTPAMDLVLNELLGQQVVSRKAQESRLDHFREFYDAQGRMASFFGRNGSELPWELSFDRYGRPTDLWRRPPLMSVEDLLLAAEELRGIQGSKRLVATSRSTHAGSASPLETRALLMLCLSCRNGGQGWPWPSINRRVDFDAEARLVSHQSYAVCDQLWPDRNFAIEVLGEEYHVDKDGFKLQTGRTAALEHMGIQVQELTYEQLADLEKFDVLLQTAAAKGGFPQRRQSAKLLEKRRELHTELFIRARNL